MLKTLGLSDASEKISMWNDQVHENMVESKDKGGFQTQIDTLYEILSGRDLTD